MEGRGGSEEQQLPALYESRIEEASAAPPNQEGGSRPSGEAEIHALGESQRPCERPSAESLILMSNRNES
jgi:hypothetical protein